jgi:hypothetical protein
VYNNTFIDNTYGVHMPPPMFQNILGENTYNNNKVNLDEEAPSFMPSLVASVILTLFGFVIIRKKV